MKNEVMNVETYREKIISIIQEKFMPIYTEIMDITDEYKQSPEFRGLYSVDNGEFGRVIDNMAFCTANIYDILDGREGGFYGNKYKGSKLKKVRKALGYNV